MVCSHDLDVLMPLRGSEEVDTWLLGGVCLAAGGTPPPLASRKSGLIHSPFWDRLVNERGVHCSCIVVGCVWLKKIGKKNEWSRDIQKGDSDCFLQFPPKSFSEVM